MYVMGQIETAGDWIDVAPWRSRLLLLIWCDGRGQDWQEARTLGEKRALLARTDGTLLAVWPGEWSTTARLLTSEQRPAALNNLG